MGDEVVERPLSAEEVVELEAGLRAAAETAGAVLPLSAAQVQVLYDRLRGKSDLTETLVVGLAFGELIRPHGFSWSAALMHTAARRVCSSMASRFAASRSA